MADRIQLRRDTAANWTAYNPILLEGEPGIEIDTDQWKLGDGVHTWSQLAYRGGECVQQRGQSTTVAMSQKAVTDELNLIGVFDISAYNLTDGQPTKYADLTAALGTNGANVPTQYRVPGMTVRYVQSSDNKYVQYRFLLSGTFTDAQFTNVANWAVMEGDIYEDNPEFLYVITDKNSGILWALRVDGDILYGAGIPTQILDYITEQINIIKAGSGGTGIDGINKIIAFLQDFSTSDTLKALLDTKADKALLDTKVDKVTGKSLINNDFSECISSEENPEFSDLLLNEQGQIVASVNKDGEVYINPVDKRTVLKKFLDEEGFIKGEQIDSFEFVGEPFTILSTDDEDVTLYDNFTFGFASQVKVHNHLYYLYYEAYGDNSEHTQGGDPSELGTNIVFAYSTDGFTWHRGFPNGVTPPNPGTNIIGIIDGDGVNLTSHVTEHQVFMVNDDVYPFRMIANHNYGNTAYTCLWKSADGFNFSHYKQIIKATDTQLCAIPRGQVIKVYCRDYDWYEDGTRKFEPNGRRIGVFYIDFDGNLLSPRKVLFGKALYQASAHVLDDHREILFPTEYGIYSDDSQRVKCYIVDGTLIKELPIDDSLLTDDYEMKSIYINSGLLNINYKQYMIYRVSKRKHNSSWNPNPTDPYEFRMIEVKLK